MHPSLHKELLAAAIGHDQSHAFAFRITQGNYTDVYTGLVSNAAGEHVHDGVFTLVDRAYAEDLLVRAAAKQDYRIMSCAVPADAVKGVSKMAVGHVLYASEYRVLKEVTAELQSERAAA